MDEHVSKQEKVFEKGLMALTLETTVFYYVKIIIKQQSIRKKQYFNHVKILPARLEKFLYKLCLI